MTGLEALLEADFATAPYDHQLREFEHHCETPRRALGWTMRTGKTKYNIDKSCHLWTRGLIDGVLIFAPNGVHVNWIETELPLHAWPGVPCDALVWRTRKLSDKARNAVPGYKAAEWEAERAAWFAKLAEIRSYSFDRMPKLYWLAVNSESMKRKDVRAAVARFVKWLRVHLIIDESDDFGTPNAKQTRMARSLTDRVPYATIMSGTMLHGGLLRAWSQFEILERGGLGHETYKSFCGRYGRWGTRQVGNRTLPKLLGYKNESELRERMSKFMSVVGRDDVPDMPALVVEPIHIEPSPEQRDVYEQLKESFHIRFPTGHDVSVGERRQLLTKIQQCFAGFLIDEFQQVHMIPGINPRLEAIAAEVYRAPGKVLVWCQFHRDMDLVTARLLDDGHEVLGYHGRITADRKERNLKHFRTAPGKVVLVGHAQSGGRGLDMSVASRLFNYSHSWSARLRAQSLERATKRGGRNVQVRDFIAPHADPYILRKVNTNTAVADAIAGTGMRTLLRELGMQ